MCCNHDPPYPSPQAAPSMQAAAAACKIVDRSGMKKDPRAVTLTGSGQTLLEKTWWGSLEEAQRAAVISHERSHVVIGLSCPCESCADKVGGYLMRLWGYSPDTVHAAYQSLHVPQQRELDGTRRNAPKAALEGARRAERVAAARGLTGAISLGQLQAVDKKTALSALSEKKTGTSSSTARATVLANVSRALPPTTIPTPSSAGHPSLEHQVGGTAPVSNTIEPHLSGAGLDIGGAGGTGGAPITVSTNTPTTAPTVSSVSPNSADAKATAAAASDDDAKQIRLQVIAGIVTAVILAVVLGMKGG